MQQQLSNQPRVPRRRWHGFSLIETMIAVAVLSLGLLGSGSLFAEALARLHADSQRRTAILFADELHDLLLAAHKLGHRPISITCEPGISACFGNAQLDTALVDWRSALQRIVPDAQTTVTIGADAAVTRYTIEMRWPDRDGSLGSERFEMVLQR